MTSLPPLRSKRPSVIASLSPAPVLALPHRHKDRLDVHIGALPELSNKLTTLRSHKSEDKVARRFESNYRQIISVLRFTNPECEKDTLLGNMSEDVEALRSENDRLANEVRTLKDRGYELEIENGLLRQTITLLS